MDTYTHVSEHSVETTRTHTHTARLVYDSPQPDRVGVLQVDAQDRSQI